MRIPAYRAGAHRVAEHLHLEAEARARVQHPEQHRDQHGDPGAERQQDPALRVDRQPGQKRRVRQRLAGREDRRVEARRLPPVRLGVEDEVGQQGARDVVQHQRRDDLVRLEERAQDARDQAPTPRRRRQPATTIATITNADAPPLASEVEPGRSGGDRADVELALAADVEEPHPERGGGGEAGERERRRLGQRLAERTRLEERGVEELAVGRQRVVPGREQDDPGQRRTRTRATRPAPRRSASAAGRSLPLNPHRGRASSGHQQADLRDVRLRRRELAEDRALVHDDDPVGEHAGSRRGPR